ncbi:MAG: hypothetical protein NTY33_04175 [Candidatus Moranbacteria bacterium]|nr:hypothetical protein [Candidatus Moranbacteria bacterium]
MQKNILKFSLFFLSLIAAFFTWFSVSSAITVSGSSVWLVPMLWLSLLYVVYSLKFILVKEKILINLSIGLGIFLSLIFAPNVWHFLILLLASGLVYVSFRQIRSDLGMNVKLHLPKTLRMGKVSFIFALALVISSQYYFEAAAVGLLKLPAFDAGVIVDNKLAQEFLYKINPDLQKLNDKNLTVDQMILQNYEESQVGSGEADLLNLAQDNQAISAVNLQKVQELQKQKILEAGREQMGKMANQKLNGTEKVSTVLTEIMNQKIQSFASPDYANEGFPAVPLGMALILFLTVLSLGAFLLRILVHLISLIFWIFLSTNIVTIKKVPVEMEVIE